MEETERETKEETSNTPPRSPPSPKNTKEIVSEINKSFEVINTFSATDID